ncbi:Ankyrin repeat-containing protein [Glycine max]|nr:Ankyrin repeat-containing protein [Glycine max]KAH1261896.1 Ankyrin repeat-containing protein [Glycine max]
MAVADSISFQEQLLQRVASAQFRKPLLHLVSTQEDKGRYLTQCVPLHKASLKGDWKEARKLLDQDGSLLKTAITKGGWATLLHIAVGANRVHFVEELLKLMQPEELELQDHKGNTAFCFAAAVGNVQIAEMMERINASLPTIRGGGGLTPLHLAVLQGRKEMAWHLFPKTKEIFEEVDWTILFINCIKSGLYDLALEMLNEKDMLAYARGEENQTGLHVLARTPGKKDTPILKLVKKMWDIVLSLDDQTMMETISEPSQVIFIAAEVGNFEFLSVVLSTYPDLIWELDSTGRSIIHIAVLHRHASIFNLIHEIGPMKEVILTFNDDQENNLLHYAARQAPPDRLNAVSGAALQMMLELSWFEEVKKIMLPSSIEKRNSNGIIPRQLFTMEHEELLEKGESWMKRTAKSCMVVSTLITTGVFTAAFSVPGGNNDDKEGSPNYLGKPTFLIFALSDSIAMISSSASILIFLSILISRYAEEDFLKSLPLKLISALLALFISIISMMVAFSSAFFITYYYGSNGVPIFISALAFIPIPVFIFLQFRLWSDILYLAYMCSFLFRPSKRMIH